MLTIRAQQIAALGLALMERFVAEASEYLLTHYPDPCARLGGLPAVHEFVRRGIERARESDIDTEGAVMVILELWIQFGEDFERSPLRAFARNILQHPELPGAAKVELIRDRHAELTGGCVMIPH